MEFTNTPRDVTPQRPASGGPQRRVFSDFAPRPARPNLPAAAPAMPPQPQPAVPVPPQPMDLGPSRPQQPQFQPRPAAPAPWPAETTPVPSSILTPPNLPPEHPAKEPKPPRPRGSGAHAGLVGFICFVVLAAVLLSPLVPGIVLDNFPGSSQSSSSGDQTLACSTDPTNVKLATRYNTKVGSPIVYNYTTTTTQTGDCGGQQQTATEGRGSQFNPLGLAIDLTAALAVAIGVGKVWGLLFGAKN